MCHRKWNITKIIGIWQFVAAVTTVQVTIIDIVIRPQCTNRPLFLASISVIWAEFTFMSQLMTFIAFNMPSMPAIVHAVIRFATIVTAISVSLLSGYATRLIRSFWHRLAGGISLSARSFVSHHCSFYYVVLLMVRIVGAAGCTRFCQVDDFWVPLCVPVCLHPSMWDGYHQLNIHH